MKSFCKKNILSLAAITMVISLAHSAWANPPIETGFEKHIDSYIQNTTEYERASVIFENTTYEQTKTYSEYMNTDSFQERVKNEVVIPVGAKSEQLIYDLYEQLSPREIDSFFQNKHELLEGIADKAVKVAASKLSMGKLTNEKINKILHIVNEKLFTKPKEVSGNRAISINANIFASAGANLMPESLLKQIRKIKRFENVNPRAGFFIYLGVGGSVRKVRKEGVKTTEFTPTIDLRYGTKTKSFFLNLEAGTNVTAALEAAEAKAIQTSVLALRPPVIEYFPSGDLMGATVSRIPIFFIPMTSALLFVDGQAVRVNVTKILPEVIETTKNISSKAVKEVLPKVITKAKNMSTQVIKPKIESGINFCRNIVK